MPKWIKDFYKENEISNEKQYFLYSVLGGTFFSTFGSRDFWTKRPGIACIYTGAEIREILQTIDAHSLFAVEVPKNAEKRWKMHKVKPHTPDMPRKEHQKQVDE